MFRRRPLALLLLMLPALALAQAPRRPAAPASTVPPAVRALLEGRYEEADALADKMDARDPNAAAVKGRAAIARGRYEAAESLLRTAANQNPVSEAALELGLLQQLLGRPDAEATLGRVAALADRSNNPADLTRAGRALRALGRFQQAHQAFRGATASLPDDPDINTAWGELFLEKYNRADALRSFQIALKTDARWTPALIGVAQSLADENPPQAVSSAKKALEINPSSVDAMVFLAAQEADASHQAEARGWLTKALAVNPSSFDARSLLAALAYVQDKRPEFEAEVAKVLAIAPNYGEVYRTVGEMAARNYRFDEAVDLTRQALTLDRSNPRMLADLGAQLLRTGDEAGAREALEASFKTDPYDVATFNMLGMLDTLDKFETFADDQVIVRMHKDEAPVLKEYAIPLARDALKKLAARYEFTPKGPILIEIFPKHDDFAVRTIGLPGMIGALGVCFGRVVAMDSPRARPPGEFQWEATLWHELAHVITVQMSNQRVPRWLTEGISVYEETLARPEWARQADVQFASMLNRGETIKLKDLNAAFIDPKKVSIAYFQGALVVEHLVELFGEAGLRRLLRAYGEGLDTDAALKSALDTDFDRLQPTFDKKVEQQFGPMRRALAPPAGEGDLSKKTVEELRKIAATNSGSFPVLMALGRALQQAKQPDEAISAYQRAAELVKFKVARDSPHELIASISIERNDRTRAIAELQKLIAVDFDNVSAARQLASLLRQTGVTDAARLSPVYERIVSIDPFDVEAHSALGRLAMERNDTNLASREFRAALALNPIDRAAAHTDLAESYFKGGKAADAKKQTLAALEIAPGYERAQLLLLKLVDGR